MKLIKRKVAQHYETAQKHSRRHVYKRPYIVPILGLLLGAVLVVAAIVTRSDQTLRPSDSHVVFLTDNGGRQTLNTKAETVGDLIKKLPLNLIAEDVVEPSLDTPIVQDNFRVNVYRARPVTVVAADGSRQVVITAQKSPRVVATDAGVTVYAEDVVNFAPGSVKENIIGEKVVIDPATPVQFNLYGTPLVVRTHTATVAALLREKDVKLEKDDTVRPALETPITADMEVAVIRNGTQVVTLQEDIPPPLQTINDNTLTLGATAVRQPGAPGKKAVTYQVVTENAVVTSRTVLQEVIVQQPVPRVVARGTIVFVGGNKASLMAAAGISGSDYGYVDYIISHESNWNPTARNAGGCLGLGQACPGSKLTAVCSDLHPVCQLRFFSGYANSRYGGWAGAYSAWQSKHWW